MNFRKSWKRPHARLNRAAVDNPRVVVKFLTLGIRLRNSHSNNKCLTILPAINSRRLPTSSSISSNIR